MHGDEPLNGTTTITCTHYGLLSLYAYEENGGERLSYTRLFYHKFAGDYNISSCNLIGGCSPTL